MIFSLEMHWECTGGSGGELRAAMSLARFWHDRHRIADAPRQVYGQFTEGFETLDLIAARELLTQLT